PLTSSLPPPPPSSPLFPYTTLFRSRHHHGRLHVGVRSVLAVVRREVLAGQPAGGDQGLDRNGNLPRVFGPVGFLRRADLLDLGRSEEHTSELQSPCNLVCRLLLEKK